MNIPMQLSRIFIREMTDMQIIELSEVGGTRAFPIVIGLPEAFAIERRLKGIEIPRPQTHALLANTIEALGGELLLRYRLRIPRRAGKPAVEAAS